MAINKQLHDYVYDTGVDGSNVLVGSINVSAGDDRILVVVVSSDDTTGDKVTGLTYDGVALTQEIEADASNNDAYVSIWYLLNPATGSNQLRCATDGDIADVLFSYAVFDGVDQSSPIDASNTNQVNEGSPTVSLTTTVDDAWVIGGFVSEQGIAGRMSINGGATANPTTEDFGSDQGGSGLFAAGTAGSKTLSWTDSDDDEDAILAVVALKPSAGLATLTVTHTTDAFIDTGAVSRTHTTDAVLRKENTKTHTTSAVLSSPEAVQFTGFETGGLEESISTAGSISVQSTTKRTGSYALKADPTSSTAEYRIGGNNDPGDNDLFFESDLGVSFWLNIASAPAADTMIYQLFSFSDTAEIGIRLNTDRTLSLMNDSTQIGSDSAAIALDTWVKIELIAIAGTSSDGVASATLSGTEFASSTSQTTASNFGYMKMGVLDSTTAEIYFDDLYLQDKGQYPGSRKIYNLKPNGVGDEDDWSGAFANIDDIPITEGTEFRTDSVVGNRFTNAVEDVSTYSITEQITAIKNWIWWKSPDSTGELQVLLRDGFLTLGGSDLNSTTPQFVAQVYGSNSSGDAWDSADIDDLEVGAEVGVAPLSAFLEVYGAGIMVAENEDITPNFNQTHTTDSFLKDTSTVSHTTSANLKKAENTLTHSTDAALKNRDTVSHTTDSNLKTQLTATHTTDSVLRDVGTIVHTTDTILRDQQTADHTTDSLLKNSADVSHTTDALLQDQATVNHTTDSTLRDQNTLTHSTDAVLRDQATLAHTTDVFLKMVDTVSHTTDALLVGSNTVTHTTDTVLRSQQTVTHTTDSLLRAEATATHTTDAFLSARELLSHTTDATLRDVGTVVHTTDAALRGQETLSHTTDTLLKTVDSVAHTTDGFLRAAENLTHTTDSNLREVIIVTHTTDALIQGENAQSHNTDTLLRSEETISHTTDALLQSERTLAHTTDSNLKKADIALTHSTNSTLTSAGSIQHTTDALLLTRDSKQHTTDSFLTAQITLTHSTDSVLKKVFNPEHDTDALLKVRTELNHTTDSVLSVRATASHTTDSFILLRATKTHTTDANIQINYRVDHTTDAALVRRASIEHSTDARLVGRDTKTHSTDARLYCNPKRPTRIVSVTKTRTVYTSKTKQKTVHIETVKEKTVHTMVSKSKTLYNKDNKPRTAYKEC